jgi:hypothetical protein
MDEDIKPLLQEIASELRTRNEMVRTQQESVEKLRSEMMGRFTGALPTETPKDSTIQHLEESRKRMSKLQDDAEIDRQEKREFQRALLAEIRSLNENLQTIIGAFHAGKND